MQHLRISMIVIAFTVAGLLAAPGPAGAGDGVSVDELDPHVVVGYRKGKKLKLKVVTIGWAEVEVATAKAFLTMHAAALEDGVDLVIYSGFRTFERQAMLYRAWREGYGNKASRPGHSNHQYGKALDIYLDGGPTYDWLEANARRFGFARTVPGEPWHWEYTKKTTRKGKKKRSKR